MTNIRFVQPPILRLGEATSTNDIAISMAEEDAEAFTTVLAETQTAGRGRAGHEWVSPPGVAIYLSVILRPNLPTDKLPLATLAVGIAAAEAAATETGLDAGIKWPNDILVNGRKTAGILCEACSSKTLPTAVVAGIGINVNTPEEALPPRPIFPATSLAVEANRPFDREAILDTFLEKLHDAVQRLEEPDGIDKNVARFNQLDALSGKTISGALPDGSTATGINAGAQPDGTLLLRTDDGCRTIVAGSVSLPTEAPPERS